MRLIPFAWNKSLNKDVDFFSDLYVLHSSYLLNSCVTRGVALKCFQDVIHLNYLINHQIDEMDTFLDSTVEKLATV